MAEYSLNVLMQLQKAEIDILEIFVRICEKYNINYFATYGTAIGCLRHQGFIPWDDDIDVGMLWEDYKKLIKVPKEEWGKLIILCDPSDDNENHYFPYPRIYHLGTTMLPEAFNSVKARTKNNTGISYNGIWIDIFIFHKFRTLKDVKKIKTRVISLRKQYLYSKKEKNIEMEHGLSRKLIALGQNAYSKFINSTRNAPEKRIWEKYMSLFDEEGKFVTTLDYPYNNCPERTMLLIDEIFPLRNAKFDRLTLKVPYAIEKHLHNIYGNYMELPPKEKRINHAPIYLDLGNGALIE